MVDPVKNRPTSMTFRPFIIFFAFFLLMHVKMISGSSDVAIRTGLRDKWPLHHHSQLLRRQGLREKYFNAQRSLFGAIEI